MNQQRTVKKIQAVSAFFRVTFQLLLFLIPAMFILQWIYLPENLATGLGFISFIPKAHINMEQHFRILHALTINEYSLGILFSLIPFALEMFIVVRLIRIFKLFETGEIFSLTHVKFVKKIGYALLLIQIINPCYELVMRAVLTLGNPPRYRFMSITFDTMNLWCLGGTYAYVPIRTFTTKGNMVDILDIEQALNISPWWIYGLVGYLVLFMIYQFFSKLLITTYEHVGIASTLGRVSLMITCVLVVFGYCGLAGFVNHGEISHFISGTSVLAIPVIITALWPSSSWSK